MADSHTTDPSPSLPLGSGWKTTVDLDGITWGQLRRLIQIAHYMDDDDAVEFEWEDTYDGDVPYVTGIVLRGEG